MNANGFIGLLAGLMWAGVLWAVYTAFTSSAWPGIGEFLLSLIFAVMAVVLTVIAVVPD